MMDKMEAGMRLDLIDTAVAKADAEATERAARVCDGFAQMLRTTAKDLPIHSAEIALERARSAEEHAAAIRAQDV